MRILITLITSLLFSSAIFSQDCGAFLPVQYDSIVYLPDINYGSAERFNGDTVDLFLDLYYPEMDTSDSRPLMIAIHGGGFYTGSRKEGSIVKLCREYAQRGYVAASISYRLGFKQQHDPLLGLFSQIYAHDQAEIIRAIYRSVQDTRGAIRFLKGAAVNYGIDTTNVFLAGESAGGFVALHTAYMKQAAEKPDSAFWQPNIKHYDLFGNVIFNLPRPDLGPIEGTLNLNGTSSDIKGIINIYGGLYDLSLINCGEPDLYQHHIRDDIIVFCGTAKAFYTTLNIQFPFTGNAKNPIVHGACAIRNYIRDSLNCCDLKERNNILPSNLIDGPLPHNYCSNNSVNIFFEDAPLFIDSLICEIPFEIVDQVEEVHFCPEDTAELTVFATGCDLQYQWFQDGQMIDDAQQYFYRTTTAGNYYCEITDCNACLLQSAEASVMVNPSPQVSIVPIGSDSLWADVSPVALTYQWLLDGDPIPNATAAVYFPLASGAYTVLVSDSLGCEAVSSSFDFIKTGISSTLGQNKISLYPNPVESILYIQSPVSLSLAKLYTIQGQMVLSVKAPDTQLSVSALEPGVYFINLFSDGGAELQTAQFVKH